ncbi:hypothetical protein BH10CYA1_BH10CYA1_38480 [soil metagenome]
MATKKNTTTLSKLNNISVVAGKKAATPQGKHGGNCNHIVVLPGYGDSTFKFPEVETLVINSLTRLSENLPVLDQADGAQASKASTAGQHRHRHPVQSVFPAGFPPLQVTTTTLIPQLPIEQQAGKGLGPTLWAASEGIRQVLHNGRFDAIIAERFDPLAGAVNWAGQNMEVKYRPAIMSLGGQLGQLRALYREALPRVLSVLAGQNPKAPADQLLEAAVGSLDEELAEILTVLRVWTDAFGQLRDGMYKQLQAVTFVVEQAFKLFETGDLDDKCEDGTKGARRPKLESNIFQVGSVFVARFSPQGPATLPGSKGPIKAHAIEVPHDERDMISLMLVLYTHEFRHDIFADIKGLAVELTQSVVAEIVNVWQQKGFKFTTEKQKVGKFSYEPIELIAQLFADTIGEVDADISGGVLSVGPAFLYNMVMTFCAFNSQGRSLFAAKDGDQLLRTSSYYELGKDGRHSFLPHPPDYIRAYIVAAALDEIGFPEEAEQCRALADQAVGLPLPKYITWEDTEGKSKSVIKIAMADLKQVAPIVAKVLIRKPLESLGGVSTSDLVNWNAERQSKVDALAQNLMAGNAVVPDDMGDMYATYIAAAATMAYWGLTEGGRRVSGSIALVEKNALRMLDTVRERLAQSELVPGASRSLCGCGKDHTNLVPELPAPTDSEIPKDPCSHQ